MFYICVLFWNRTLLDLHFPHQYLMPSWLFIGWKIKIQRKISCHFFKKKFHPREFMFDVFAHYSIGTVTVRICFLFTFDFCFAILSIESKGKIDFWTIFFSISLRETSKFIKIIMDISRFKPFWVTRLIYLVHTGYFLGMVQLKIFWIKSVLHQRNHHLQNVIVVN